MKHSNAFLFAAVLLFSTPELGARQADELLKLNGLKHSEAGAYPGFTLFSPLRSNAVFLVSMKGEIAHQWDTDLPPGGGVYLLDNGHLLRSAREPDNPRFNGGGIGGRIQEFDWEGNLIWDYVLADDYQTQHHDLAPLPNGNVLAIVWEHRFKEDAVAAGRIPASMSEKGIWTTAILELKPVLPDGAEVVWEWHLWDHLIQDFDESKENYGSVPEHPGRLDINYDTRNARPLTAEEREEQEAIEEEMSALGYIGDDEDEDEDEEEEEADAAPQFDKSADWMHMNAVDYNAKLDLIVLSSPEASEIFVIDHGLSSDQAAGSRAGRWKRGGDLLYRWGNPANYGPGQPADRKLYYQHDPTWLNHEGGVDLLIFNNGGGRNGRGFSSVDQLSLPFNKELGFQRKAGQAFAPKELSWSYSNGTKFFSGFISGAQRLPNGNTLICAGAQGRVFEVTEAGKLVWDYVNPYLGTAKVGQGGNAAPVSLFRATRIGRDHPGLKGLKGS